MQLPDLLAVAGQQGNVCKYLTYRVDDGVISLDRSLLYAMKA